jgi:nucleoside-diphosphate-sugar epimerase
MKVIVTGAGGFIGSKVVPLLARRGHEVHAIYSKEPAHSEGARAYVADLLTADPRQLIEAIRPSHLLHLAWHVPPGKFWTAEENIDWLHASLRLLKAFAAADGRRWAGAGTCAEYDWTRSGLFEESDPCVPATLYGACKHALNTIAARLGEQLGVEVASGRIFFPYGPGEPAERLVPSVICSLLAGKAAECTDGRQARDYIFVEDVAAAFVALLEADCLGPVNIGSGASATVGEIAMAIGDIIGRRDLVRLGARPSNGGEPAEIVAGVSRLRSLGWAPHHDLQAGLERCVEWWRARI